MRGDFMAVVASGIGESRIVLRNVSWETFEALLAETDRAGTRFTYDEGVLEIMSPSMTHERMKKLLARMIETMTLELQIPIASAGNSTLKNQLKQKGVEPDECYYVANEPRVRGKIEIDLDDDPMPDLAIEIDISSSSLDQLRIYAALGIPEVWLCDGETIRVYQLGAEERYLQVDRSPSFPFLPVDRLQGFLDRVHTADETSWIRSFQAWVKSELMP